MTQQLPNIGITGHQVLFHGTSIFCQSKHWWVNIHSQILLVEIRLWVGYQLELRCYYFLLFVSFFEKFRLWVNSQLPCSSKFPGRNVVISYKFVTVRIRKMYFSYLWHCPWKISHSPKVIHKDEKNTEYQMLVISSFQMNGSVPVEIICLLVSFILL